MVKKIDAPKEYYDICIEQARKSPCRKLGFGAVLLPWPGCDLVYHSHNRPIKATEHVCRPDCVRLKIASRTDALIGACLHAEELVIREAIRLYGSAAGSTIFVQGVRPDGTPLVKKAPVFTCLRCATAMLLAGVSGAAVWYQDVWWKIAAEEAYRTALVYALGVKEPDSK